MVATPERWKRRCGEISQRDILAYWEAGACGMKTASAIVLAMALVVASAVTIEPGEKEEVCEIEEELISLGIWTITAYCGCEKCCGSWAVSRSGPVRGAEGTELIPGRSAAAPLPFGTILIIGDNEYVVQDRTANWIVERYGGKIVDIYFETHEEAETWGKQQLEVFIKEGE